MLSKIGPLLEGLSLKNRVSAYWQVILLLRWGLTLFILVYLRDYPALQIIALFLMSLGVQIATTTYKPYAQRGENLFSVFNEFIVTVYLVFLLVLLPISPIMDQAARDTLGLYLQGAVFFNVGASFLKMIVSFGAQLLENHRLA